MSDYAPLTQEMIDLAHARKKRIALQGVKRKLTTMLYGGKCYALEDCEFRGRYRRHPVRASVKPAGQAAKLVA